MSLTFVILLNATQDQRHFQQITRYKYIADIFLTKPDITLKSPQITKTLKKFELEPVSIEEYRDKIEKKGETFFRGDSIYGTVRVFKVDDKFYIYVERFDFDLFLQDNKPVDYTTQLIFTIAIVLFLLLLALYIMLLKKLAPLKRLNKEIEEFAEGNLDTKITYEGDDEVAKIAKSFEKAIKYIKQLISSKNLFMRNIMHELKTPITTSRIAAEGVEDEFTKKILIKSFDRMNELIEELAQVERITMYSFNPIKADYKLSEIFDEAKKMLLKEEKHMQFTYQDMQITTDKELLALVLKNLIDNAIKYSPDRFANVVVIGNKILVKSKGKPLKEDLSYYIEPFSQEEKRSLGFGLGLYIVANILDKLGYDFRYRYDNEQNENIFEIVISE
jgi:two-component system OmpR family sensor kinase